MILNYKNNLEKIPLNLLKHKQQQPLMRGWEASQEGGRQTVLRSRWVCLRFLWHKLRISLN
jgi:hypothetical protein